jgi:serine/threonine-protein kinase
MSGDSVLPRLPGPGDIVDGKYEIVGVVGRGGMGVVFEAVHKRLRQRVALKMLHPHVTGEPGVMERFEREARAAGQLLSPNIARVLDVETSNTGLPFIVMEFLEGRDLQDELETKKQLPIDEAVGYVLQACSAMREAHALGIIHRDLKPANIFLCPTPDGPVIKILDFGISKITTEVDGRLTAAMTTLGSPIYMSPEQLRGASEVDARTDLWSLGVVLYELLAGQPPYSGTLTAVTAAIIADAPPRLATFRDDVPPELEAVVGKALQKFAVNRFPNAESMAEALLPFASDASARRLHARLSTAPAPPSSRRAPKASPGSAESMTVAAPVAPSLGSTSETRHSFTTGAFERSVRTSRSRVVLLVAGALAVGALATIVLLVWPATPAAPRASGASAATTSARETAVATPAAPVEPPIAAEATPASPVASSSTSASASAASSRSATPRSTPQPQPRSRPAAAATNPLRL